MKVFAFIVKTDMCKRSLKGMDTVTGHNYTLDDINNYRGLPMLRTCFACNNYWKKIPILIYIINKLDVEGNQGYTQGY